MKKKQISIVFNPHNMQENRKKAIGGHIEKNVYKVFHDKERSGIEMINSKKTSMVERFCQPRGERSCQACYREIVLCNGITDINNVEKYVDIFNRHKVSTELLQNIEKIFLEEFEKVFEE